MIPQQLIDGRYLRKLDFQIPPVRFQDFKRNERQDLLHKSQHPGSQQEDPQPPLLKLGMMWYASPPRRCLLFYPHGRKRLFGMFEMKQKPEQQLVLQDSLPRNHER